MTNDEAISLLRHTMAKHHEDRKISATCSNAINLIYSTEHAQMTINALRSVVSDYLPKLNDVIEIICKQCDLH